MHQTIHKFELLLFIYFICAFLFSRGSSASIFCFIWSAYLKICFVFGSRLLEVMVMCSATVGTRYTHILITIIIQEKILYIQVSTEHCEPYYNDYYFNYTRSCCFIVYDDDAASTTLPFTRCRHESIGSLSIFRKRRSNSNKRVIVLSRNVIPKAHATDIFMIMFFFSYLRLCILKSCVISFVLIMAHNLPGVTFFALTIIII